MKHKPNPYFFYRGNYIVKLWEQYLKWHNDENIQFYTEDGNTKSIFNGLTQQKEIAIVLNHNNTLYLNKDGNTITLCGEINYKPGDINIKIKAALDQITAYNRTNGNVINNHLILFPYHVTSVHWNLGVIKLTINEGSIANHVVSVYNTYGGQTQAENYILDQITSLFQDSIPNIANIDHKSQQQDGSSCGAITAENGKEFLKKEITEQNLLEAEYSIGAKELRSKHIEEINEDAFYKAQMENRSYEAKGDNSIENQFEIISLLRGIINQSQYVWVKQVLLFTQRQNDDIIRENLDLFKKFLIQQNISGEIQQEIFARILREEDGGFQEGAIDLINILAFNFNNPQSACIENVNKSALSVQHRQFIITHTEVAKERDSNKEFAQINLKSNEKFSRDDFEITKGSFIYKYDRKVKAVQCVLFLSELIGESNNLLFRINDFLKDNYADIEKVFERLNFNINEVLDSRENNILHYAVFRYDLKLISIIIHKAKVDGVLSKLLNHRNLDGTSPLGMAFLFEPDNLSAIQIAKLFVNIPEYQISEYLNNKKYMDYSYVQTVGGTNILHNVILAASKCTKEAKESISEFFKILTKRLLDEQEEKGTLFNPNDPTMNPMLYEYSLTQRVKYKFTSGQYTNPPKNIKYEVAKEMMLYQDQIKSTTTDLHMISTSRLFTVLSFNSKRIKQLCEKYFNSLLQFYEAVQHDDSSGDSEDETSHAHKYREILHIFDSFIKQTLGEDAFNKSESKGNFQRTFDNYKYDYSPLSHVIPLPPLSSPYVTSDNDQQKWNNFWEKMNSPKSDKDTAIYKDSLSKMIVPLFHGVPFMHSQYSNYQRREIVEKINEINKKLLGWYDECTLSRAEEIRISIHSRTATATCGMKSLHDIMSASDEDLHRLDYVDGKLRDDLSKSVESLWSCSIRSLESLENEKCKLFGAAMKNYVFNFADSPIKDFWEVFKGDIPEDIVKYRFPVVATSKAPDHPIRFAIGRNVEGNRGEIPMQPEYDANGYPTHRIAGLLYITMYPLRDLVQNIQTRQAIDVNNAVKIKLIGKDGKFERFANQLEMDFFGKIDSNKVVCIIPIVYPHIRDSKILQSPTYQMSLYSIGSPDRRTVTNPENIKTYLDRSPNPDTMTESSNLSWFGKIMVPSIAGIANGLITSIALKMGYFLCSITDTNKLVPYNVKFDQVGQEFTKAQQEIRCETSDLSSVQMPLWELITQELINDNLLNEEFTRLSILGEL